VNEAKSAVAPATRRQVLGFSFWVAEGGVVKRRLAPKALARLKTRVRELTRRNGRSTGSSWDLAGGGARRMAANIS
jgi:hypothetical protein